jgi:hypothetical protein
MDNYSMSSIFTVSDDIVAREIEGELIIVPLVAGIGDLEDELFTLNETGKAIWKQIDGKTSLETIVTHLADEYTADQDVIKRDVLGLVTELTRRRMLVPVAEL